MTYQYTMAPAWKSAMFVTVDKDFFSVFPFTESELLGKGKFGDVVLAKSTNKRPDRAVKRMPCSNSKELEQFKKEANIHVNLSHSCIVKMFLAVIGPQFCYITLEICPNGDLCDRIPNLKREEVCSMWLNIACAVAYIHHRLVVHLDIKPDNILINHSGRAVLVDFGKAERLRDCETTITFKFGADPVFQGPEVRHKDAPVSPYCPFKAEMYSVGVVLWQMLVNEIPWKVEGYALLQMLEEKKENYPEFLCDVLRKVLHPDPEERCSSKELLTMLTDDKFPEHHSAKIEMEMFDDDSD